MYLYIVLLLVLLVPKVLANISFNNHHLSDEYFPIEFAPPPSVYFSTVSHIPIYTVFMNTEQTNHAFIKTVNWNDSSVYLYGQTHPKGDNVAFDLPTLSASVDCSECRFFCHNFRPSDRGFRPSGEDAALYMSWSQHHNLLLFYITFLNRGRQCFFDLKNFVPTKAVLRLPRQQDIHSYRVPVYATQTSIPSNSFSMRDVDVMVPSSGCIINLHCDGKRISGIEHPLYKNVLWFKQNNSTSCVIVAIYEGFVPCQIAAPYFVPSVVEMITPATVEPPKNSVSIPPLPARRPPILQRQVSTTTTPASKTTNEPTCRPVETDPAVHLRDRAQTILMVFIFIFQVGIIAIAMATALFVYRWRLQSLNVVV